MPCVTKLLLNFENYVLLDNFVFIPRTQKEQVTHGNQSVGEIIANT